MKPIVLNFVWRVISLLAILAPVSIAQIEPDSAQVDLYFPQLADGGSRAQQWQTSLLFLNPSTTSSASVTIDILGNNGQPLDLDFGSGPSSTLNFILPPQGSRAFRSKIHHR